MWENPHMLFWLSLVTFCANWFGDHHLEAVPTALYGVAIFASAIAVAMAFVNEWISDVLSVAVA